VIYIRPLLLEATYRNADLDKIDILFDSIMGEYRKGSIDKNAIRKRLDEIGKLVKRVFNLKTTILISRSGRRNIEFGMLIIFPVDEFTKEVEHAIETDKDGFKITDLDCETEIHIEEAFIRKASENGLTGKHMTSTLLHEVGHKIYLKEQEILDDKKDKEDRILGMLGKAAAPPAVVAFFAPLSIKFKLLALAIYFSAGFLTSLRNNFHFYNKSEMLSDRIPTRYGYAKEFYECMNFLEREFYPKENRAVSLIRWFMKNFDPIIVRKKAIISDLKRELATSESRLERKNVERIIKEIKEL
jgi:hypothetical protein